MTDPQITPELEALIAKRIMENQPHLYALAQALEALGTHGQLEVVFDVRGRVVEKMTIVERKSWVRQAQPKI